MKIYTLTHLTYSWEDNDYSSAVELFYTLKDAQIYYDAIKQNIVSEFLHEAKEDTVEDFENNEYAYYYEYNDPFNKLYISYDEFGSDELKIEEKNILSFKEEI